jgi:hypothetical protein
MMLYVLKADGGSAVQNCTALAQERCWRVWMHLEDDYRGFRDVADGAYDNEPDRDSDSYIPAGHQADISCKLEI